MCRYRNHHVGIGVDGEWIEAAGLSIFHLLFFICYLKMEAA